MEPRRQAIPVLLLVKTALQLLWQQRDDALRLGLVPTLLLFGGFLYGKEALAVFFSAMHAGIPADLPPGISSGVVVLSVVILAAICLLTVNWLRFLLLGPMGAVGLGLAVGPAHVRFLFAAIGLSLALVAAMIVLSLPLAFLPGVLAMVANLLVLAAVLVLIARFLPFLIGQAIGQSMTLSQSWKVSRGNAMPLAMSLILVQVPFMLGFTLLQQVLGATGFTALAPAGTVFIVSVVQVADWICQASVMATAYRHMVGVRV
jgi:hypothetical protein